MAALQDPARIWLNADNLPYPRYRTGMRSAYQVRRVADFLEQQNWDEPLLCGSASWSRIRRSISRRTTELRRHPIQGSICRRTEDAWQVPLIFRDSRADDKRGINAAYYQFGALSGQQHRNLLELLKKHKRYENTMIVYMADHGYCLGHHGRFEKHCGYDPGLASPAHDALARPIRQGVVATMTESVDVPHTILDMLGAPELPVKHGQSLRPYLEGKTPSCSPASHVFSEYLENEEAFVRTATHKFIYCSGKRERTDGYKTDRPTPGRYMRLYDLHSDPGEFTDVAAKHTGVLSANADRCWIGFDPRIRKQSRSPQVRRKIDWTGICDRGMREARLRR